MECESEILINQSRNIEVIPDTHCNCCVSPHCEIERPHLDLQGPLVQEPTWAPVASDWSRATDMPSLDMEEEYKLFSDNVHGHIKVDIVVSFRLPLTFLLLSCPFINDAS